MTPRRCWAGTRTACCPWRRLASSGTVSVSCSCCCSAVSSSATTSCTSGPSSRPLLCRPPGACPVQRCQPQKHRLPPQGRGEVPGPAEKTDGTYPRQAGKAQAGPGGPRPPPGPLEPGQEPGPGSPGGSSPPRTQWWRPWLDHAAVIHSGDYFLFESDSEEEEEAQPEDPRPSAQSAFQMAYQAWVTNAQTVLRRRRQEQAQRPVGGGPGPELELAGGPEDEVAGRSHVMQRVLSTMQFLWVLGQALVDGLTRWLHTFTRHHRAMSNVLRAERYLLTQELLRGREVHRGVLDQLYSSEAEATPPGPSEARDVPSTASRPRARDTPAATLGPIASQPLSTRDLEAVLPSVTSLPSHSGLGAEEPISSTPEDPGSPLSTGYNTRSGSEEMVTEPRASLRGSRELPASTRTRMRTASELLLDRCLRIPELEEAEQFEAGQGRALRLLQAVYQCVAAHSELLCYFIIVLNHMVTPRPPPLCCPCWSSCGPCCPSRGPASASG
ncbi:hypothetical protein QTO34_010543 [Cnephaeus nilssonii]|uniref:Piezo TM25-28 domain-containing protein n=1 Tax=Cnephaeus nilssonii TaxID=3371016 RepID=A0AA40HFK6_CNENI|nr:hypothetical protein QTO34_010543 [Eptesicus nilssonii]